MSMLLLAAVTALVFETPTTLVQPAAVRLAVFLDCAACDPDFVRTEITFVSYVQDRESADLHVLVTSQPTAAGGQAFTMTFLGRRAMAGQDQTLSVVSETNDSEDRVRRRLTQTLRLGLLRYLAGTALAENVQIRVDPAAAGVAPTDPWNHWIFALAGTASLAHQESQSSSELDVELAADRVTDRWKITIGAEAGYNQERFTLDDGEEIRSKLHDRELRVLIVKSLGRHWSVGAQAEIESSTFENKRVELTAAPAIEYNLFPYEEATRRELRIQYAIGPQYARYREETIFGRMRDTHLTHEVSAVLDRQEPWGTSSARLEWSQFLGELSRNRLEGSLDLSLRVTRGLSVTLDLQGSRIRDQVSLPARDATPEEILLQQRELASGYDVSLAVGITYRFGSLFSRIVNPRFGQ
jgi:hypothetical protein